MLCGGGFWVQEGRTIFPEKGLGKHVKAVLRRRPLGWGGRRGPLCRPATASVPTACRPFPGPGCEHAPRPVCYSWV